MSVRSAPCIAHGRIDAVDDCRHGPALVQQCRPYRMPCSVPRRLFKINMLLPVSRSLSARSGERDVHLLTEGLQASSDIATDAAYLLPGLPNAVSHWPVHVSAAGVDRAGVSAPHGDHVISGPHRFVGEGLGNSASTGTSISSKTSTNVGSIWPDGPKACRADLHPVSGHLPQQGRGHF
jgi:hypothetical protein